LPSTHALSNDTGNMSATEHRPTPSAAFGTQRRRRADDADFVDRPVAPTLLNSAADEPTKPTSSIDPSHRRY
jgi:hypothetical protein